jgi:hypothetical protein
MNEDVFNASLRKFLKKELAALLSLMPVAITGTAPAA